MDTFAMVFPKESRWFFNDTICPRCGSINTKYVFSKSYNKKRQESGNGISMIRCFRMNSKLEICGASVDKEFVFHDNERYYPRGFNEAHISDYPADLQEKIRMACHGNANRETNAEEYQWTTLVKITSNNDKQKMHAIVAMLKEIKFTIQAQVKVYNLRLLVNKLQYLFDHGQAEEAERKIIDLSLIHNLILDEIGVEQKINGDRELFNFLVEARKGPLTKTIYTTSLTDKELAKRYGDIFGGEFVVSIADDSFKRDYYDGTADSAF